MPISSIKALAPAMLVVLAAWPAQAETWTQYAEIGPALAAYETTYPALCQRYDLGLSVEGRHLWALRITDNVDQEEDEPEFKYIAAMHGDEIVGTKMCMLLIDHLLVNYGTDQQATTIVDQVDLWIVPLMNPDGYDRTPRTRYNAHGVDLNRNFPNLFDPNTTAGREPETAHVMNWTAAHSFTVSANFHGGALVVNYPFDNYDPGSQYSPDNDLFVFISEAYSHHNPPMWGSSSFYHGITNGADWYVIHGSMQDWNYHFHGDNEVTIELGNNKQPPASEIPAYWNDNRAAMLAYVETALIGVRGRVTDAQTQSPLAAIVTVAGRNHEIYTDPDVGDYHRMLLPGTYDLLFEADGHDPAFMEDVAVSPGDATRQDVQMHPGPRVVSPDGGEVVWEGLPVTIEWTGNPAAQFQVHYTDNHGDSAADTDGFERMVLGSRYVTGGAADWFITSSSVHSGALSVRAGDVGDYQASWMSRTVLGGDLSFWYRVSSEPGDDLFRFTIDGELELTASGTSGGWTQYSTTLADGSHELLWEFHKDGSVSSGSDTVWIDDLAFTADVTKWTEIVALTGAGDTSVEWTPVDPGDSYAVRVRAYCGGGTYGQWDESDAPFTVQPGPAPDGDYDGNGTVDLLDYAAFQRCCGSAAGGACGEAFEFVIDGVIDAYDHPGFEAHLTGP